MTNLKIRLITFLPILKSQNPSSLSFYEHSQQEGLTTHPQVTPCQNTA